jgi:rod shape-determining protein MreC
VAVLVLVSLALLTVYFRESSGGGLHSLQGTGASILKPFEVAANRVAQPFRDAAGWVGGLSSSRDENKKLKKEVAALTGQQATWLATQQENRDLRRMVHYLGGASYPSDYTALPTSILAQPSGQFDELIVVGVGRSKGVKVNSPVVSPSGYLVGLVSKVFATGSQVKLITDETSAVSIMDAKTSAAGILRHNDPGSSMIMDNVPKSEVVNQGDQIVTAGWKSGDLTSLFPRGIPVGWVNGVNQTDIDPYKQIQVTLRVDFGSLQNVIVLVKKPGA